MGIVVLFGIMIAILIIAAAAAHSENIKEQEALRLAAIREKERKEEEKRRAAQLREAEKERNKRERERLAAIVREQKAEEKQRLAREREAEREAARQERDRLAAIERENRAREKDFQEKDKPLSKIENQLRDPATFRELCSAIARLDDLTSEELRFLSEHAPSRYPSILRVRQSGKDRCLIDYMDVQFDAVRAQALRPIGIDEFAKVAGKLIKPFEDSYQSLPRSVKDHYNNFTGELFGRWADKC